MKYIYLYGAIYIIIFSLYMIFFYIKHKRNVTNRMIEIIYLEKKYNLDLSKVNYYKLCRNIALVNSFIFTVSLFIMSFFDNYLMKVLLAFVTAFILIIIGYGILALYYKNKYDDEEE